MRRLMAVARPLRLRFSGFFFGDFWGGGFLGPMAVRQTLQRPQRMGWPAGAGRGRHQREGQPPRQSRINTPNPWQTPPGGKTPPPILASTSSAPPLSSPLERGSRDRWPDVDRDQPDYLDLRPGEFL